MIARAARAARALAGWKGYALAGGLCLAIGFAGGWQARDLVAAADERDRLAEQLARAGRVIETERASADVTEAVETEAAAAQVEIRWRTQTLIREVPVYVTPQSDARCPVPVGFVRVHDHAAMPAGGPLPEPAGVADDAPSGVALSAVAETVAGNYGSCHATARQLSDLQAWVRAQAAVMNDGD